MSAPQIDPSVLLRLKRALGIVLPTLSISAFYLTDYAKEHKIAFYIWLGAIVAYFVLVYGAILLVERILLIVKQRYVFGIEEYYPNQAAYINDAIEDAKASKRVSIVAGKGLSLVGNQSPLYKWLEQLDPKSLAGSEQKSIEIVTFIPNGAAMLRRGRELGFNEGTYEGQVEAAASSISYLASRLSVLDWFQYDGPQELRGIILDECAYVSFYDKTGLNGKPTAGADLPCVKVGKGSPLYELACMHYDTLTGPARGVERVGEKAITTRRANLPAESPLSPGTAIEGEQLSRASGQGILYDYRPSSGNYILLCRTLNDVADLVVPDSRCKGVVVRNGGYAEHDAIRIRAKGLPAIRLMNDADYENLCGSIGKEFILEAFVASNHPPQVRLPKKGDVVQDPPPQSLRVPGNRIVRANINDLRDAEVAAGKRMNGVGMWRVENWLRTNFRDSLAEIYTIEPADVKVYEPIRKACAAELRRILEYWSDQPVMLRFTDETLAGYQYSSGVPNEVAVDPLGIRACRLGLAMPALTRAIIAGVLDCLSDPEVKCQDMWFSVPMVSHQEELAWFRREVDRERSSRNEVPGRNYKFGINVETPRACMIAATLAADLDFMSFGTNDLTQYCWALSRGAAGHAVISMYKERGLHIMDPFVEFDTIGVGDLMVYCIRKGREVKPDLLIGVSGEFANDPEFCAWAERQGVDYFSIAPALFAGYGPAPSDN